MKHRFKHGLHPLGLNLERQAVLVGCLLGAAIIVAVGLAHFHQAELKQLLVEPAAADGSPEERAQADGWKSLGLSYRAAFHDVVQRIEAGQLVDRRAARDALTSCDSQAERLSADAQALADARLAQAQSRAAQGRRLVGSLTRLINVRATVAVLVLVLAVSWFRRSVLLRLKALSAAAQRLASGDLSVRVEVGRGDELGALAQQLNDMASSLQTNCQPPRQPTAAAQSMSQAQSQFLARLSQELRARLTVISVHADMLLARRDDPEVLEAANTVQHNSEYLLEVINDICDLSKIETGHGPAPGAEPAPTAGPQAAPRFRVLLAEDGPENRRLMSLLLQKAGADVVSAENGRDAVDEALGQRSSADGARAAEPFHLILMDMQMPVMDGYEATRRLRQSGYAGLIIAVTGHTTSYDRQKCLEAGCNDYLAKPIDREKLLSTLSRHIACRQRHHRPAAPSKADD